MTCLLRSDRLTNIYYNFPEDKGENGQDLKEKANVLFSPSGKYIGSWPQYQENSSPLWPRR